MNSLPKGVRFGAALALLGVVMFLLPPQAAGLLGILLVLGALVGSGPNPAAPIKALTDLLYGGK
jgi:drug/metabolite transporter (DMT)-like permease